MSLIHYSNLWQPISQAACQARWNVLHEVSSGPCNTAQSINNARNEKATHISNSEMFWKITVPSLGY